MCVRLDSDVVFISLYFSFEDKGSFALAANENNANLVEDIAHSFSIHDLIDNTESRIPIFSTTVNCSSDNIFFDYDVDGVVVQFSDVTSLTAPIHYFNFEPAQSRKVRMLTSEPAD